MLDLSSKRETLLTNETRNERFKSTDIADYSH